MAKRLRVELGERSYEITIKPGILPESGRLLREKGLGGKALVVTNPTVARFYLPPLLDGLKRAGFAVTALKVPDGEKYKTLAQVKRIYDQAAALRLERTSVLIALGGGVIGDLTGFAAATYLRGIPFVQVPTTLLAQVDSAVGGKVGVNHRQGKNLIGAFYQPAAVLSDPETLLTLPEREIRSGLAEVIKAGLIRDAAFAAYLSARAEEINGRSLALFSEVIYRACEIKARVVEEDEKEHGLRAILNYGHTIGHALEAETGYRVFRHGEAVALGMAGAATIGELLGCCGPDVREETATLLRKFALPVTLTKKYSAEHLYRRMFLDKKVHREKIRFVLPRKTGEVFLREDVPQDLIYEALRRMGAR